jgi:type I restriction enzyme S subunit
LLPAGTVVFSRTATVGKATTMGREMTTSQDFANYVCGEDVHGPYLVHLFRYMRPEWDRLKAGSTHNTIYMPVFRDLEVLLPPVTEQRAIAEALGDVDALLASLDKLIAKERDIKEAAMQQLLTRKTRLPGFSGDWAHRRLLDAVRLPTGQVDPRQEPFRSMLLVAPDHVEEATGRLLRLSTAAEQGAISGKYLFQRGDIVYSKIRPYLRKAVLATFDGLSSADMYPLSPQEGVSGAFMHAVILGHDFSTFATNVSARSGIPKINRDELAQYSLPLPAFEEQEAIAAVLTDMDSELAALDAQHVKTQLLKQGMMQELLTGMTRLA